VKLYTWTREKPLKDGGKVIQRGDTVAMSDERAKTLAEFIKPVKEVKEPKAPKPPDGVPTGKIAERVAALKAGS
jgi:hypothetical protein